jgi:rod shape-determining protein MreD
MRRFLISCAVIAVALLAQLTFINRLTLPGGAGPDLVLLAVVALSLTGGPLAGLLTGFLAGLALDIAPPASHTIGQYALVFCLVGYGCGRLAGLGDGSPSLYVAISAAAAAVGAALHAVLGVMLSDPEVTWAAVRYVLPPSLIYDVILSPFVLYAVVRLNGWTGRSAAEESSAAASASAARPVNVIAQPVTAGAVRQAGSSGTPKLNLGDRRGGGSVVRPPARRSAQQELKLNFSGAGKTAGAARAAPPKTPKVHFSSGGRRDGAAPRAAPPKTPKMNFGGGGRDGAAPRAARPKTPKMNFGGGGRDGAAPRAARPKTPKMNFGGGRDGRAARAAVPRFRRHSGTGTLGTGGTLSRATPRRGTFASQKKTFAGQKGKAPGRKTFARRGLFGARSSGSSSLGGRSLSSAPGRRSAPRLRMRRGTLSDRLRRLLPHRASGNRYSGNKYAGKYTGKGGHR